MHGNCMQIQQGHARAGRGEEAIKDKFPPAESAKKRIRQAKGAMNQSIGTSFRVDVHDSTEFVSRQLSLPELFDHKRKDACSLGSPDSVR